MTKSLTLNIRTLRITSLFLGAFFVTLLVAHAKADIAGCWAGAFTRFGAVQNVVIDFRRTDSGWVGSYSIPDLILYREALTDLSIAGDTLSFHLFWGSFSCLVHNEIGEITGENRDWNPSVAIHLKRCSCPNHPQIEEVRFPSGSLMLSGSLLLPDCHPPYPAVVVIEGSTMEGRELWSYRSIGDLLARNGIAALVYDKRGISQSVDTVAEVTFDDLANDAVNAVQYLTTRDDINAELIGLFGISQGGWLAPLAADRTDKVSFVVLLAGPAVSIWQQDMHRVEYGMRAGFYGENEPDVFSEEEIAEAIEHTRLGFDVAQQPERWADWEASVTRAKKASWADYVNLDSTLDDLQGWLRFRYDPKEILENTTIPVLALFGENDILVPPAENIPLLERYLAEAGNSKLQIVTFPNVGHDFFTGATLVGREWSWPTGFWRWNRRAVGLADTIITWTRRQVHR